MEGTDVGRLEREFHQLTGALDAIGAFKEELELRLEEARDDCVREVLDNIIALADAQDIECRRRRDEVRARLQPGSPHEPGRRGGVLARMGDEAVRKPG